MAFNSINHEIHTTKANRINRQAASPTISQCMSSTKTSSENKTPPQSSVVHIQTDKLNAEMSEQMAIISEMKENFNNDIKEIMNQVESKSDLIAAIKGLCSLIQSSHERMSYLHELTQQNLLKLLAVQKYLELNNERRDDLINIDCDKIQMIETKMACSSDLNKIWITFTSEKEISDLRKSKSLISDAKRIFKNMDIDVDEFRIVPIRSACIQHIKVRNSVIPTLCITFINDRIATTIRRKIISFNAHLEVKNRLDELRYCERMYWSKNVWKLLRICWELKRIKLINSVFVTAEGIRVSYNTYGHNENLKTKAVSTNVICYSDIDKIWSEVCDIYPEISCRILYDHYYFRLKFAERDSKRSSENAYDSDDSSND